MNKEILIKQICQKWGEVLHPKADSHYWDKLLSEDFAGYYIDNWSDLQNYGKAHMYNIRAHKNVLTKVSNKFEQQDLIRSLGGYINVITLELSAILPYYLVTPVRYSIDAEGETVINEVVPDNPEFAELFDRAERFAERSGFTRLPKEFEDVVVPGVELDLAERDSVTIYNCLFLDSDYFVPA